MYYIKESDQDSWVNYIRAMEGLMKEELHARKRRYFALEKTIREIRRNLR